MPTGWDRMATGHTIATGVTPEDSRGHRGKEMACFPKVLQRQWPQAATRSTSEKANNAFLSRVFSV